MKVWKMVKNRLAFFGTWPCLRMSVGLDAAHRVFGKRGELVVGLVGKDVAVSQKEDARAARGFAAQVPAAVEQLPGDLKGDERLAGAGGERQKNALLVGRDGFHCPLDGDVLKVAAGMGAALVLEGHGGEAVAPRDGLGEGQVPEFVRRGIARRLAFLAGLHVNAVNALAIGAIGVANGHDSGVVLGLRQALGQGLVPGLGFDDGELGVAIFENVVGDERLGTPTLAFEATESDLVFAADAAALDDTPACRFQRGIDVLGSGFGFVHGVSQAGIMARCGKRDCEGSDRRQNPGDRG